MSDESTRFDDATNAVNKKAADDFVGGADKPKSESTTPSIDAGGIKLIVSGRLDKKAFPCGQMALHLDKRLDTWLKTHATGNRQLMVNYLIARGIAAIKDDASATVVSDMDYIDDKD